MTTSSNIDNTEDGNDGLTLEKRYENLSRQYDSLIQRYAQFLDVVKDLGLDVSTLARQTKTALINSETNFVQKHQPSSSSSQSQSQPVQTVSNMISDAEKNQKRFQR